MSKCKKVKNPCKICLGSVNRKNGLQCQGACECWIHYSCLNYTPGKIKDIKAGLIAVTCPCPDCKSTLPKEFLTDQPYSCTNMNCPANQPPKCGKAECPINIIDHEGPNKMSQTTAYKPRPIGKCGTECKENSYSNMLASPALGRGPPPTECPARSQRPRSLTKRKSSCSSSTDVPGDYRQSSEDGMPSMRALEQMCNTVGQLTNQINSLMEEMRNIVQERHGGGGAGGCGGGNLQTCGQPGPKALCPKPCYCPGNPERRK